MKTLLVTAVIVALGWYGLKLYHQGELPRVEEAVKAVSSPEQTKCIDADGQVYYGQVPADVRCQRIEPVAGSMAVVSGEDFGKLGGGGLGSPGSASSGRHCDGRTQCTQMTSCAEARFFLANCPGVEMDGDRDGVPCEEQWCGG